MKIEEVLLILKALHQAATHCGEPDLHQELEERDIAYEPDLWHESIALWQCVVSLTETRPDDPSFAPKWEALTLQARLFTGDLEHEEDEH